MSSSWNIWQPAIQKACEQHASAIQSVLVARERAYQPVGEVMTLKSGVRLCIGYGSQGYQVVGIIEKG